MGAGSDTVTVFSCYSVAYTAAFNGVKYIFTQMGAKSHLELTSFVVTLIALCLFTVVFGRFFCGFACAFGSLGDAVRAFYVFICKKRKKKPVTMKASVVKYLQAVKYVVLVLLVVSCYTGVYSKTRGMSHGMYFPCCMPVISNWAAIS